MIIQVYAPTTNAEEAEVEWFCDDLQDILELTPKKDIIFIIGDWNAKIGSQELLEVIGKFGFETTKWSSAKTNSFAKRTHGFIGHTLSQKTRYDSTHRHHQMVNTEIRLIIFFAAKDGEALHRSSQKQDWELTVAQIMNSLLPNSGFNWRK